MADFIVEEDEIDGNGQVVRWGSLCLLQMSSMSYINVSTPSNVMYNVFFVEGRSLKRRYRDKLPVYHHLLCKKPRTYLVMLMTC